MSVGLEIKIKHLPKEKRRSFNFEETCMDVMRKYPIMRIKGSVMFGNADKCDIGFADGVIYFSTNFSLYDYMAYAAYAFADVLGVGVIDEEGKEVPLSELSESVDKVPKMLEEERRLGFLPVVYRLKPKGKKFRLLQIENAIEKINQNYGVNVLVWGGHGFVLPDKEKKRNLTEFEISDLSEIEVERPEKETDRFEKVLSDLVNELHAELHKEE